MVDKIIPATDEKTQVKQKLSEIMIHNHVQAEEAKKNGLSYNDLKLQNSANQSSQDVSAKKQKAQTSKTEEKEQGNDQSYGMGM
ncbi:MAG: hypothetical protein WAX69_22175 [Victivallales bacterium]